MGNKKRNRKRGAVPNKRKIDYRVRTKLAALFILVLLAFLILVVRVIYVSAAKGEEYERRVRSQNQQSQESTVIPARRGDITDRNGTVLATSEKIYNVILDCKVVNTVKTVNGEDTQPYVEPTVQALVEQLGLDEEDIRSRLTGEETKESPYQRIALGISINEKNKFEEYRDEYDDVSSDDLSEAELQEMIRRSNIQGVWFEDTYKRVYPLNSQACDLIGFTYSNGTADWGLEGYYSDVLDGTEGRQYSYYGASDTLQQEIIEPEDGNNVVSTIDANIQKIIRSKIEEFNTMMAGQAASEGSDQQKGAENVGVILMDPNNGEVLGMDSTDWYDLNNPRDLSLYYSEQEIQDMIAFEEENAEKEANGQETADYDEATGRQTRLNALNGLWRNFCISDTYEPGSTAKPMNVAAAYETNSITDEDTFVCDGSQQVGGFQIKCAIYPNAHGTETAEDALKNSCNDALMQIAEKMGSENFLKYQHYTPYWHQLDAAPLEVRTPRDQNDYANGKSNTVFYTRGGVLTGIPNPGFAVSFEQDATERWFMVARRVGKGGYNYQLVRPFDSNQTVCVPDWSNEQDMAICMEYMGVTDTSELKGNPMVPKLPVTL